MAVQYPNRTFQMHVTHLISQPVRVNVGGRVLEGVVNIYGAKPPWGGVEILIASFRHSGGESAWGFGTTIMEAVEDAANRWNRFSQQVAGIPSQPNPFAIALAELRKRYYGTGVGPRP